MFRYAGFELEGVWIFACFLAIASGTPPVFSSWDEGVKISPADGWPDDRAASSVDLDGAVFVLGAPRDDDLGSNAGSAYIYRQAGSTWVLEQKVLAPDGAEGDYFGSAVAINGDVVAVGARNNEDRGAVYVFRFDSSQWVHEQKLMAADGAYLDLLGGSVDIFGDVIVIGACGGDPGGSTYIFRFDGTQWVQEKQLLPPGDISPWQFGSSVCVGDGVLAVGDPGSGGYGTMLGSAHVFRYDGYDWNGDGTLVASDGADMDRFGASVALGGDIVAVGAELDDDMATNCGSVYIFRYNGSQWAEEAKLLASNGAWGDRLGGAVALSGDTLLAGARGHDYYAGAVYAFRLDGSTWHEEGMLLNPDPFDNDEFGNAVVLDDDVLLVGARLDNTPHLDAGSAYVFEYAGDPGPDCNGNGVADDVDIADGTSEDCNANGIPDECDIADGTSLDRNGNGVPDECELNRLSPIYVGHAQD